MCIIVVRSSLIPVADRSFACANFGTSNRIERRIVMATEVAGGLYYEIDGQLAEIKRQLRQSTGYPFDPCMLRVALQNAIEGHFGGSRKQSLFSIAATTSLVNIAGKPTKDCFTGSRYAYRDGDFDTLLPAKQPNTVACIISTLAPSREWTFVEGAAAILGIGAGTDIVLLGTALIENGHIMTLAQAEQMVEKTERNENTKMRVDGYGNFFFVETGDPKNPVSVGLVFRDDRDWHAYVLLLDYDFRWHAGRRLLIRNLKDTLKLGR